MFCVGSLGDYSVITILLGTYCLLDFLPGDVKAADTGLALPSENKTDKKEEMILKKRIKVLIRAGR